MRKSNTSNAVAPFAVRVMNCPTEIFRAFAYTGNVSYMVDRVRCAREVDKYLPWRSSLNLQAKANANSAIRRIYDEAAKGFQENLKKSPDRAIIEEDKIILQYDEADKTEYYEDNELARLIYYLPSETLSSLRDIVSESFMQGYCIGEPQDLYADIPYRECSPKSKSVFKLLHLTPLLAKAHAIDSHDIVELVNAMIEQLGEFDDPMLQAVILGQLNNIDECLDILKDWDLITRYQYNLINNRITSTTVDCAFSEGEIETYCKDFNALEFDCLSMCKAAKMRHYIRYNQFKLLETVYEEVDFDMSSTDGADILMQKLSHPLETSETLDDLSNQLQSRRLQEKKNMIYVILPHYMLRGDHLVRRLRIYACLEDKLDNAFIPKNSKLAFFGYWIGGENVHKLQEEFAKRYLRLPKGSALRWFSNFELQRELILSDLMHDVMPYLFDDISSRTTGYFAIDGDSAFYDDRFRCLATKLYLNYCYTPQL